MPRVSFSCWSVTSAWPYHLRSGAQRLLAPMIVRLPATTMSYFFSQISKAPDGRGVCQLLNVYIIMASWVPPLLREFNYQCFESSIAPDSISTVILYGIGLATYAWRFASKPKQLLADEETGDVQPSLLSDPVTEPWDSSSTRHLSERMSSLPSASVRDSRRESERKSRLEKQPLF
jgi:hypothetical protein